MFERWMFKICGPFYSFLIYIIFANLCTCFSKISQYIYPLKEVYCLHITILSHLILHTRNLSSLSLPIKMWLFLSNPALLSGAFHTLPCLCNGLTFGIYVLLHQLTMDSLTLPSKSLRTSFALTAIDQETF